MRNKMCHRGKRPLLEASGNISLSNVSAIAQSGIDRIAVGEITHSARAVDIAVDS
jgi:nicotinate-nucleotide pyrophosphorylase (carboxylating)